MFRIYFFLQFALSGEGPELCSSFFDREKICPKCFKHLLARSVPQPPYQILLHSGFSSIWIALLCWGIWTLEKKVLTVLFSGYKVVCWVVKLLWSQVVRSWYVLGRLGGFNSMNMQVCFLSFSPQLNLMHPVNLLLKSWRNWFHLSMEEHAV